MNTTSPTKIPLSERAIVQRINRRLAKQQEKLLRLRGGRDSRWWNELGNHYVVDADDAIVIRTHVDIEALAKELRVVRDYECLAEASAT